MSDYLIRIEDQEISMYLGLHDFEKQTPQRVLISIEIDVSGVDYAAGRFFDYDAVVEHVRGYNASHIETQEELTKAIHDYVLGLGCKSARVYSCKPDIFTDCKSVGLVFSG